MAASQPEPFSRAALLAPWRRGWKVAWTPGGPVLGRTLPVLAALIIWGPPALRQTSRELGAALANPFAMDFAAAFQSGSWVLAAAVAGALLVRHLERGTGYLDSVLAYQPLRWYALFGVMAVASAAYSPSPFYTVFFAAKILIGIILLTLLAWRAKEEGAERILGIFFFVYASQALAIVVLRVVDPRLVTSLSGRLHGGMFGDYGSSALFAGLWLLTLALFTRDRRLRTFAIGGYVGSWVLLILSQTRSVMACGAMFFIIMGAAHKKLRKHLALIGLIAVIAIIGFRPDDFAVAVGVVTREGEGIETLSGRTDAFSYLAEQWEHSPVVGYGYAAGTRDVLARYVEETTRNIGAGHDVLSTVLVDLGVAGTALLLAAFLTSWRALVMLWRRTYPSTRERLIVHQLTCLLAFLTLQSVTTASIAEPSMVFIVSMAGMWSLDRRLRRGRPQIPTQYGGFITRPARADAASRPASLRRSN